MVGLLSNRIARVSLVLANKSPSSVVQFSFITPSMVHDPWLATNNNNWAPRAQDHIISHLSTCKAQCNYVRVQVSKASESYRKKHKLKPYIYICCSGVVGTVRDETATLHYDRAFQSSLHKTYFNRTAKWTAKVILPANVVLYFEKLASNRAAIWASQNDGRRTNQFRWYCDGQLSRYSVSDSMSPQSTSSTLQIFTTTI
jgi:hypothetical protein